MKYQKGNIIVAVIFIVVIFIVGFILYMYSNKDENSDSSEVNIENQIENKEEETVNLENEMEKIAKNGDILVMNYTGRFVDGKVFDSNVLPEFGHVEPFKFKLGAGQVIKGWDEGLVGMKIGEKKTLTIPPEKAYGPNDYHSIPGNSTLIFDVELIDIE